MRASEVERSAVHAMKGAVWTGPGQDPPGASRRTDARLSLTPRRRCAMSGDASAPRLGSEVQRLHAAVAHWSRSRWDSRIGDGRARADVVFDLVVELARLGGEAGSGAPPEASPPRLGSQALPDQLAVVGAELVAAPGIDRVADAAASALAEARRLLLS